jgi:hypothetical protein
MEKDWEDFKLSAELINISHAEELLKLLGKGLEGEIRSNYPTIHQLKCYIQDIGGELTFSSGSLLMAAGAPPPATFQRDGYGLAKKFHIVINNIPFLLPKGLASFQMDLAGGKITGAIDELVPALEEVPYFLRSIHKIDKDSIAPAAGVFKTLPFRTDALYRAAGLLKFQSGNTKYKLFDFELNSDRYLIIDAEGAELEPEFRAKVNALILVYAFMTGYYIQDRNYMFYSTEAVFMNINCFGYYKPKTSSKEGITVLAPRHISEYIPNLPNQRLEPEILTNLMQTCLDNVGISRALEILANSLDYPESVRGAVYSVVLETLKDQILSKESTKFNPIKEKLTNKNIIKAFTDYINTLPEDAFNDKASILKKIENLNQTGNLDGFYKIFEDRGFILNDHDRETIRHRNNFLHGRLPMNDTGDTEYLTSIILKMHLLLSALILADSGYIGYYFNFYKYRFQKSCAEDLYRTLK